MTRIVILLFQTVHDIFHFSYGLHRISQRDEAAAVILEKAFGWRSYAVVNICHQYSTAVFSAAAGLFTVSANVVLVIFPAAVKKLLFKFSEFFCTFARSNKKTVQN